MSFEPTLHLGSKIRIVSANDAGTTLYPGTKAGTPSIFIPHTCDIVFGGTVSSGGSSLATLNV